MQMSQTKLRLENENNVHTHTHIHNIRFYSKEAVIIPLKNDRF